MEARSADGEGRHVEIRASRRPRERRDLLDIDPEPVAVALEVGRYRLRRELIVTRRDRGMGGKHGTRRDRLESSVEIRPAAHQVPDAFQYQERGVSFVDVPYRRPYAQGGQSAHAAHSENDLLLDPGPHVAAVKAVRDVAVELAVFRQI